MGFSRGNSEDWFWPLLVVLAPSGGVLSGGEGIPGCPQEAMENNIHTVRIKLNNFFVFIVQFPFIIFYTTLSGKLHGRVLLRVC